MNGWAKRAGRMPGATEAWRPAAAPALVLALALTGCAAGSEAGAEAGSESAGARAGVEGEAGRDAAGTERMDAAMDCAALRGLALGDGTAVVAAAAPAAAEGAQPAYCVAQVAFTGSTLRLEARMPPERWNRRLAFLGGGGFDGLVNTATEPYFSPSILSERYATLATNGGYDAASRDASYFQAAFASDPVKRADFTHLSEHRALPAGRELIARYYGSAPVRSYFEGCSMGGHDALVQAQRYPEDFDGIVARAPAGNAVGLMLQFHRIAVRMAVPEQVPGPAQRTLLARAVLAQCDALDGLEDGIVSRPEACAFDPRSLLCGTAGAPAEACLSEAQLATVEAIATPMATADGRWTHAGYPYGGEDSPKGWGEYAWPNPALGGVTLQGLFSDGFLRAFVVGDPAFDTAQWDAGRWSAQLDAVGAEFNAVDPDLAPLRARGAKLLLWNGTTDSSVSARETVRYYRQVVETIGQAAADEVVELFLAPGVGHCSGGPGADRADLLAALAQWVEREVPPSRQGLQATRMETAEAPAQVRPLCKYPAWPRYRGDGDGGDAAGFECAAP